MQQRTDADLVLLACMGNQDASNELIRRYQAGIKRVALKIVGQEELASEIAQEAFLTAYLSLGQLRDPSRFRGWLTSIVRNFALGALKEQRNRPISLDQLLEEHPTSEPEGFLPHSIDPEAQVEERALQQLLLSTISILSQKERSAVLLYYYRQHSIQEIAALLNISETAVKSRLFKARRTLRDQLSAEYEIAAPQMAGMKGTKTMDEERQRLQKDMASLPKPSPETIHVLTQAYTEARGFDQPFIGTEHLLLVLLHPEIKETAEIFTQAGITLEQARSAVRIVSPHVPGEIAQGMSRDVLTVMVGSLQLVRHFQHQEQKPMHLLLSLLSYQVLNQLNISPA